MCLLYSPDLEVIIFLWPVKYILSEILKFYRI